MVGANARPRLRATVLLLGLGGIWVEALRDVQCSPAGRARIISRSNQLRSAKLLAGVRRRAASGYEAVVKVSLRSAA